MDSIYIYISLYMLQVNKLSKAAARSAAEERSTMQRQNQDDITGIVATMSTAVTVSLGHSP